MSAPTHQALLMSIDAATLFLMRAAAARGSPLDATHQSAYTDLINGLITDGLWLKFDILRIYATQDSATALLNLVSSSYNGTASGSPTFTADRGFTGVNASTTVYITSGFVPNSAPSPKFTQNSAHISAWNLTNTSSGTTGGIVIGSTGRSTGGGTRVSSIIPKYNDGNAYFRINGANTSGVAMSDARGHFISNRSGSTAVQGYKNGSSVLTNSDTSQGLNDIQFVDLADDNTIDVGGPNFGGGFQIAGTSVGSSLSGTDATNYYNRLRTYMTAVGVP